MTPRSLRLGCVQYLNARPLVRGWKGAVEFNHPANLCRALEHGELDVALVSSFEFLRNPIYSIVDNVAIASDGPVFSVFVAHRDAIEAVAEILIDPASQTSVNLLRVLLHERGLTPRFVSHAESATPDCARLLIGDQAIRFRDTHPQLRFWDLGEQWRALNGKPFVYALWLVRPEVPQREQIGDALRALRDANLREIRQLIAEEQEFDHEFCARYYGAHLQFDFGQRQKRGLWMFQQLCAKHGLLPPGELSLTLC